MSSQEITAPELLKKLKINRATFDSWVSRGQLDEAILKRRGPGQKMNVFDFDKVMNLVEALTAIAPPKDPEAEPVMNLKPQGKRTETEGTTITKSKAIKEAYAAQLAKLDYEERVSKLVDAKKVKRVYYNAARVVRNNLLAIPGRVAAEVTGMTDDKEVEKLLTDEILSCLEDLQNVSITES